MALEILCVHLFILVPVLVVLSWGKAFRNTVGCNICSQPNSKAIRLQFYNDTTDFPGAEQACHDINSTRTLLSERVYGENRKWFHKYLRDLNHSNTLIWLDWSTDGIHPFYSAKIFNTSGVVGTSSKENDRHSRICVEQSEAFSNNVRSNSCSQCTSKVISAQFYNEPTDFYDAQEACSIIDSTRTLMSETVYEENKECVNKYLRDLNHLNTSIWLYWSSTGTYWFTLAKFLRMSGDISICNIENNRHSRICVEQVAPEYFTTTSCTDCSEAHPDNTTVNNKSTQESSTPVNGYMTTSDKDSRVPDFNKDTPLGTDNSKPWGDNCVSVAHSLAVITVAVVLTLCCIFCVACSTIFCINRKFYSGAVVRRHQGPPGAGSVL